MAANRCNFLFIYGCFDKVNVAKQQKDNIRPFEEIFLGVGADVLSFMSSVLTANPDAAVRSIKEKLKSIKTNFNKLKIY